MTPAELFEQASILTKTTGQQAPRELLDAGQIQGIGAGGVREPYPYFLKE
jgi:hypothetical protein